MPLDRSSVGYTSAPFSFSYDWKTTVLYALGIGAKRDELAYLYEGRGPEVYPTFAVIPVFGAVSDCLAKTGGDYSMVVHGGQSVVVHRATPPEATLATTGTLTALYDLKKFAQAVVRTTSRLPSGEVVFETEWSILYRGQGNFGGEPPPPRGGVSEAVAVPKDRPADFRVEEPTSPEQALLYRLSGDLNPLHADPAFAEAVGFPQGPILHGLASYGFAARALVKAGLGGKASRLRRFDVQFRKPVWPGETLVTEGWRVSPTKIALQTSVAGRPEAVLTGAWAEVAE